MNNPKGKKAKKSLDAIEADIDQFLKGKELNPKGKEDFKTLLKRSVKPNKSGLQSN